jgi:tetratricopeptide (TPR) repeat protein
MPLFAPEAAETVAASVVAVASLDEQGRVARQGLGVGAGKEGCIVTCASLVDRSQGGVIMTPTGTLHRIRREIYRDELQDPALVEIEAAGLTAAPLAPPDGLSQGEPVSLVVEDGERFAVREAKVASLHPFSPRLRLVKLEAVDLSGLRAEAGKGMEQPRQFSLAGKNRGSCQKEKALQAFQQAVQSDARFEAAYLETGKMLLDLGRPKEAALPLAKLLELEPRHLGPAIFWL